MNNNNNTNNNNLDDDDDDLYTIVEPIESYQSSSTNCGVSTIISSRQIRPFKQLDMLLTPCSHNSSFSLCNTIMLPYITSEESIECNSKRENNMSSTNEVSNTNAKSELVHSETLKESQYKHIKLEKEKSQKNTLSLKDVKINKEKGSNKNNFTQYQNSFLVAKNLSCNNGNINKIDINININKIKKLNLNNMTYNNNNENNSNTNSNSNNQEKKNKKKEHIIKDNSKIDEENESFVQRKFSMRVGENKNHISDMEKSDNNLKKIRKVKIKHSLLNPKYKFKIQDNKKREDASLEKSKSLIDEKNSKKHKKMESDMKIKTSKNFFNTIQIKNEEKSSNENYKKIKKKNTKEIKDEDEEEDSDDESMKKNNKKKKIKNNKNEDNKKDWKVNKFRHFGYKMKINKSVHIKPNMNIIREIIKNRKDKNKEKEKEKEKKNDDDDDNESDNDNDFDSGSDDNCKEKDKNSKIEKRKDKDKEFNKIFYTKKSTINNDKKKEEEDKPSMFKKRNANRQKTFTNEFFKKLRFSKKEDKKEEKREENEKSQKQKIKKEKEKNKNKDKYDSFNISIPQKHFCTTTKNIYKFDVKNKDINSQIILRKERSNSLILKNSPIDINKKKINLSSSLRDIKLKKKLIKK